MSDPSNPLQVQAFDHITLIAADLEATRKFYVDTLGMRECERPKFGFPGIWFEVGGVQIHITQSSDEAGKAGWGDRGVKKVSRGHHFAFAVSDFEAALNKVNELGISIGDGPKTRPDGAKQLYIYDPDGHLVELFTHPPR